MRPETDPDLEWVGHLSGARAPAAERAVSEAQAEHRLFRHIAREHAQEGRDHYVEIDAPLELYALVRLLRPRHVVEVGVSSGVSSAYLLQALDQNGYGTLHSVDLPQKAAPGRAPRVSWSLPPGRSSGWAVPFPLRKRWDLRLGDKREVVPLLAEELDQIGLFVYDVPHDDVRCRPEFLAIDARLPRGGIAIVDHGADGDRCPTLRSWGRRRGAPTWGRQGTGLYGFRAGTAAT